MVVPNTVTMAFGSRPQSLRDPSRDPSRHRSRTLAATRRLPEDETPVQAWDGLRKDADLWFDGGDCLIHLYAFGASRRGPSFRLRADQIDSLGSTYLVDQCLHIAPDHASSIKEHYEIYLPAGSGIRKDEAYAYHVTTRNCFAFVAGVPLVGQRLGPSLIDLWDRLQSWDAHNVTLTRFYEYCENQGYLNLAANAGHALAILAFAEHVRDSRTYTDAFVHCAGMQDWLELNPEYPSISEKSKILIGRAGLEMELHIAQVSHTMSTFLEDELGPAQLNLSKPARDHLDRFRSFLINHYVEKHGYYPPPAKHPWKKSLWLSMYHSFQCLYEYLADTHTGDTQSHSTGVNVAHDIQAFDQRHGFDPLPYTYPLLPTESVTSSAASVHSVSKLTRLRMSKHNSSLVTIHKALERAANTDKADILDCSLVKDYRHFERQKVEEKMSLAEARQVRWMLVYSTLQMLISIIRAPAEVRDVRTPTYPLCVLTADCPPWEETDASTIQSIEDAFGVPSSVFEQDQIVFNNAEQLDHVESCGPLRITTRSSRSSSQNSATDSSVSTLQTPRSSSSISDECESPVTETSLSDCESNELPPLPVRRRGPLLGEQWRESIITIGSKSVHAGCYEPTGFVEPLKSPLFHRKSSDASLGSLASSTYPDDVQQAADIEEVETRGRRRMTGPRSTGQYDVELPTDLWVA